MRPATGRSRPRRPRQARPRADARGREWRRAPARTETLWLRASLLIVVGAGAVIAAAGAETWRIARGCDEDV